MSLDEILGVGIDKPFNIVGQSYSNPYVITYKNDTMIFKSLTTDEEVPSWILIKLINDDLQLENC